MHSDKLRKLLKTVREPLCSEIPYESQSIESLDLTHRELSSFPILAASADPLAKRESRLRPVVLRNKGMPVFLNKEG